ncbi:MAG: T9SS type A sorting domain-containing protein [Chitinophagales bacterium]
MNITTSIQAQCSCSYYSGSYSSGFTSVSGDWYPTYPLSLTGVNVHVTGNLVINTNLTITDCILAVDPGFEIVVNPGFTFTVINSTLNTTSSTTMWKGVRVLAATSTVPVPGKIVANTGSLIANAERGIHIDNESPYYADFNVSGVKLCNNRYGMYVDGYVSSHPGAVDATEFCGPNLLSPYAAYKGIGIYITSILGPTANINIGNGGVVSPTSGYNYFHDLQFGIQLNQTNATIRNNFFKDIYETTTPFGNYGIFGTSVENFVNAVVKIGEDGAPGFSNVFDRCNKGIYLKDFYTTEIYYNWIRNNSATGSSSDMKDGMRIENCPNTHILKGNRVQNFNDNGILGVSNSFGTFTIHENLINNTIALAATPRRGIGIINITPVTATVNIYKNTVTDVRTGIALQNISDNASITGNTVSFMYNGTGDAASGIKAINCFDVLIDRFSTTVLNTVTGSCTGSCEDNLIGIDIDNSQMFRCYRNTVNNCDVGIRASNNCEGGNFVCNTLNNNTRGFGLRALGDPAMLGPVSGSFGTPPITSDNKWYPTSGTDYATWANRTHAYNIGVTYTDGPDIYWNYRTSGGSYMKMDPAAIPPLNTNVTPSVAVVPWGIYVLLPAECNFTPPRVSDDGGGGSPYGKKGGDEEDAEEYIEQYAGYIMEKAGSSEMDFTQWYLLMEGAYKLLHTGAVSETDVVSDVITSLNETLYATQIPFIYTLYDSINARKITGAKTSFETFSPENSCEEHIQKVLSVYFNTSDESGNYYLTAEDSTVLYYIAKQSAMEIGPAVYIARAMLDITIDFPIEEAERLVIPTNPFANIYPNPVSEYVNVVLENTSEETELLFYDVFGKIVKQVNLTQSGEIQISVSDLKQGLYLFRISDSGGIISSGKIVKL